MTKSLKYILIGFSIILLPLTYLMLVSIGLDKQKDAYFKACQHSSDIEIVKSSLETMTKVMKIYPWGYMNWMNKAQLQLYSNDYRGALKSAKRGAELNNNYAEGLEFIGLLYEYLELSDSSNIYYFKAINKHEEKLTQDSLNSFTHASIGLLYCFVNDSLNANRHIELALKYSDNDMKGYFNQHVNYINHYKEGGLKDFLDNKTAE